MEKEIFKFRGLRIEVDDGGFGTQRTIYEIKSELPLKVIVSGLDILMSFIKKGIPYFYFASVSFYYNDYVSYQVNIANPYFGARYCFEKIWNDEINIDAFLNKEEVSDFIKTISGYEEFSEFLKWSNSDIDNIIYNLKLLIKYINKLFYHNKSFIILEPDIKIDFYDFNEYNQEDESIHREELDLTTIK